MKQCLLLFTFLCVAILPSFSQQKIDIYILIKMRCIIKIR